ncbi:MAG: anti-ECFsigma factor, ChrR [Gemmatimonadetes bacterium]|jgi:quercetin dioxygenase-like cupin family protein|nr:anti-ECFsigma factor, ChrR [Gemmatimonadota bacterium]
MRQMKMITLAMLAIAITTTSGAAQAPAIKYGPAPAVFPEGAKMAVLAGDPGKSEQFIVRLDFPAGYAIQPHWHPTDEHITVIEGTLLVGMGDTFDAKHMMKVGKSGFVTAGAKMHHYARANGHTVVQIDAMGPFAMTYVNPADDPSRKTASKK